MSGSDILGIVAIILAVAGISATVVYGRRALQPRRRVLRWHVDVTPVIADKLGLGDAAKLEIDGVPMSDPYWVKLDFENAGDLDIESTSFDQGRPIEFLVTDGIIVKMADPVNMLPRAEFTGSLIKIGPDFLQAKAKWHVTFIADGKPGVTFANAYLHNVHLLERSQRRGFARSADVRGAFLAGLITLLCAIGAIFALLVR